jgi:hypothetical protein
MNVLITKANEDIIKGILPKVKFKESTKNTSTFSVTEKKFKELYDEVKTLGYNPFALMVW